MIPFLSFLHVSGIIISLGSAVGLLILFSSSHPHLPDPHEKMKFLAAKIQRLHPLYLFGICLTFMTGAMRLTDLKIGYGAAYYPTLGKILMWKFGMTTVIFMVASMQCFGMGLKFGRMANGVIPSDLATQERYARKIKKATLANILFILVTVFIGLKLIPIIYVH